MATVEFTSVTKSYPRHGGRQFLKSWLASRVRQRGAEKFYALRNVSFRVERGASLAVVGPNGAGKSTLLSLVAGLAQPDSGTIAVRGRVATLLELGAGFHPDLTGAENLRVNAALLGLSRRETQERTAEIVRFSGIQPFIDEPLRTYSSGMVMRLAFAVSVHVDADVILIDEILAVGDMQFQARCFERLAELREQGKTLVCASHAGSVLEELCDQAIWLSHGEIAGRGTTREVLQAYQEVASKAEAVL
jgi:ABC-type polysaccharide/polyol phosphate transport system ATPase subunit